MITPTVRAAASTIAGNGVFAQRDFAAGDLIRRLAGESCTLTEVFARVEAGEVLGSDVLGVDDDLYLVLDELDRSFNHSCDPNAYVEKASDLVARRPIRTGEEITFDYSTTMNDDERAILAAGKSSWTCPCSCLAPNCRGEINQFRTLAPSVRRLYLDNQWAPDFILRAFS